MPYIPDSPDDIDADWLNEALRPCHPTVHVSDVQITRRQEWTNSHAWLTLQYDEAAQAPPTLFCKLLPSEPERRAAVAGTGMGLREAKFYERLAPHVSMRVPTVHAVRYDESSGAFILLLEDLAAGNCWVSDGPTGISPHSASGALRDMAELHVRYEHDTHRSAEADWVTPPAADSEYGAVMLQYGLDHHRERLSAAFAELAELYIEKRPAFHAMWDEGPGPRTVIHGDAHIGNLFEDKAGLGFLDWGMINFGKALRDVAYFIAMALSVEDRRRHEEHLLKRYLEYRSALGGGDIGFDEAWRTYRLYASYTVVACCQVVTFPENVTEKRRVFAESLLARSQAIVEDLEVRKALREFAGL